MSDEGGLTPTPTPTPAPAADALLTPPAASWRDGLAEDLRGNAVFANYGSLDDFAKGHIATKALASSKVPMPGDTPESFKAFAEAVRPADPAAYEIAVPEGMPTEFAEGFRAKAHELGLHPAQVKEIAAWNNAQIASVLQAQSEASQADFDQFRADYDKSGGNFSQKLDALKSWLPNMGVQLSAEDMAALDAKIGSANLMRFMFNLHDQVGDLETPPSGGTPAGGMAGAMSPAQAEARQSELFKDASWRQKAQIEGSAEHKENERLTRLIVQGRVQAKRGPQ